MMPQQLTTTAGKLRKNPSGDYILKIVSQYRPNQAERYKQVILSNAEKYNLDPLLILQVIKVESRFKWWARSGKDALGPMQVMPRYWKHLLYRIADDELKKKLMIYGPQDKYFQRIGYGVQAGCYILRHYINNNDGNVMLALIDYGYGPNTRAKRRAVSRGLVYIRELDYIKKVIYNQGIK
jgi:soluble lytic murein transglycosylase-like protein